MGKREELGDGAPRAKLGRESDGAGWIEAYTPRRRTEGSGRVRMVDI